MTRILTSLGAAALAAALSHPAAAVSAWGPGYSLSSVRTVPASRITTSRNIPTPGPNIPAPPLNSGRTHASFHDGFRHRGRHDLAFGFGPSEVIDSAPDCGDYGCGYDLPSASAPAPVAAYGEPDPGPQEYIEAPTPRRRHPAGEGVVVNGREFMGLSGGPPTVSVGY